MAEIALRLGLRQSRGYAEVSAGGDVLVPRVGRESPQAAGWRVLQPWLRSRNRSNGAGREHDGANQAFIVRTRCPCHAQVAPMPTSSGDG